MNHSKLYDQIVFTFGVFWVAITAYLSGAHPECAAYIFTVKCLVLLSIRAHVYFSSSYKYFMWDFCYLVNFLILAYLYLFRDSEFIFKVLFACSLGPLAWAIPSWRNSLVFHSLDKMTSVFIHLGPPLLMYELRWFSMLDEISPTMTWEESVFYPMLLYFLWQVYYFLRVVVIAGQEIEDKKLETSYSYLTAERYKNTWYYKIIFSCGPECSRIMFILLQTAFTVFTLLPVKFLYEYKMAHFMFYIMMMLICTWNGASFYFDVFAKRYYKELAELSE